MRRLYVLSVSNAIVHTENTSATHAFSTASFASAASAPDVNVDDPQFWEKLLPDGPKISADLKHKDKVIDTPRNRKHAKVYAFFWCPLGRI